MPATLLPAPRAADFLSAHSLLQIGDPAKAAAACASPRACVASFPTTVVDGLLYVWLEAGPQVSARTLTRALNTQH